MAKQKPRTLSGFMELLPGPQQQMERIMEVLRRTYSLYGFYAPGHAGYRVRRGAAGQGRRRTESRSTGSRRGTAIWPSALT